MLIASHSTPRVIADPSSESRPLGLSVFIAAVQRSSTGYAFLDERRRIEWVSDGFVNLTGYGLQEAQGLTAAQFIEHLDTSDSPGAELSNFFTAVETAEATVHLMTAAGDARWCRLRTEPFSGSGRPMAWIFTITDVSESERDRRAAIEAADLARSLERVRVGMMTNLNHEVRSPLAAMMGAADVLEPDVPSELREFTRAIRSNGLRLLETFESIMTLSQLQTGEYLSKPTRVQLSEVVSAACEPYRISAQTKHLSFDLDIDRRLDDLFVADAVSLRRITAAIVSNAVRFTRQGRIHIQARIDGSEPAEHLALEVADTGPGMSDSFLAEAIRPFRQESSGHNREYEGVGVGLTIADQLCSRLGGQMVLHSAPDRGTRVLIQVPLVRPAEGRAKPPVDRTPDRPSVLHVEDQPELLVLTRIFLEKHFRVVSVSNPKEAISVASEQRFDLFLLDINLRASIDGVGLMEILRRDPRHAQVPMIACTAFSLPEEQDRFLAAGFMDVVTKPFAREVLVAKALEAIEDSSLVTLEHPAHAA